MNLLMAPLNSELQIIKVKKGRGLGKGQGQGFGIGPKDGCGSGCSGCEKTNQDRHLTNLGFVEGAKVVVINETQGNLIVKVKDSRLAIGKDIARKIMVKNI